MLAAVRRRSMHSTFCLLNAMIILFAILSRCFQETAYMREGTTDIRTPVRFLLTLQLQQDEPRYLGADFGVSNINQYPILNQREAHKEIEIPFHKSCGGDDLCESKLQVNLSISFM